MESKADLLGQAIREAVTEYESIQEIDIYGFWSISDIEEFKVLINKLGSVLDDGLQENQRDNAAID